MIESKLSTLGNGIQAKQDFVVSSGTGTPGTVCFNHMNACWLEGTPLSGMLPLGWPWNPLLSNTTFISLK